MSWIKDFSKSASNLSKGQTLKGYQPLDFYHFFPLWYDLWIKNIALIIRKLQLEKKHFLEIRNLLPPPSNIRAILIKLIPSYFAGKAKNKTDYKLVANFFARILKEGCPKDPFALKTNLLHSNSEITNIIKNIKWIDANIQTASKIGQIITAAGSLVHGLYNDLVTDFGWDVYGPYAIKKQTLLIRHFPNLKPKELWPKKNLANIKELYIYTIYENIEWTTNFVGCHTTSKGKSPVISMKKFAVIADKKQLDLIEINNLTNKLATKATNIYNEIKSMNFEDLKSLVMKQECYQLKILFDKAKINWEPTNEMILRTKNKPLLKNIFPLGKFIKTTKEFNNIFGINKFEKEILKSHI
jgi:hypothetical protein